MVDTLRNSVADAYSKGKTKAEAAVETSKVKASKAAQATKASAQKAKTATVEGVDRNPLAALVGGLALGALAAALLPRTQREDKLVGKAGKSVREKASSAAKTARSTAMETLDTLGVNADAAKDQIRDLAAKLGEAATTAGKSAAASVKNR
jgi:ElaB/YqjD/DUF883 family membrane-anchored ribosome-binding protein